MAVDAVVGKVFDELLKAVVDMKDRAVKFRPTLKRLESTLQSLEPLVRQIDGLNKQLDRPAEETKKLIDQMERGKKLVLKCSKVQWWNCCHKAHYQEQLEELDESMGRIFKYDMPAQTNRNVLEILVAVRDIPPELRNIGPRRTELSRVCSPPQPPEFTVGLDVPLRELKLKSLKDHDGGLVLTVTGPGGLGKSTLTKKFCWDEAVKGMNSHLLSVSSCLSISIGIVGEGLFVDLFVSIDL
ncbi:disease resistance protein [Spatholobus suberectus]|nr:disease resistance protein [Spatholobus suberectus]